MAMSLIQDAQTRIRHYGSVPKRRFRDVYTSYLPDVRLPAYLRQQQHTTTTDRFDRIPLCNIPNPLDLAAALAGMSREEVDRTLSMSPPMSANNSASALYPGLQQAAAASAFGMLSPSQLLAANRQAAAAFMAAQLPTMSTLASTLFPHHPALFGSWASAAPHMPLSSGPHSPPASPHSPINVTSPSNGGKHSHGMISPPTTGPSELPLKKPRKLSVKKDLHSPPMDISAMNVSDLYSSSGPISPPSSGSSPNSTHDGHGHGHGHGVGHGHSTTAAAPTAAGAHTKDPSRDKSFTCKICSRSFGYKHVLQNHERTHTGEKPFECPECHKRFTRDHHLKTHMRLHTGEKPYHCSHCDRQFVQVANLRRHLRVHTGERPYTCEICDGKFSDSNQLKSHMLVHNGEKPFECERCHMKFRRRHHLLNHKCGSALLPGGSGMHSPPNSPCADINANTGGEYTLCDQKSVMGSSYGSEESMDVGRPANTSGSSYELMEQHGVLGAAHHHHHHSPQQQHHQPHHAQLQQPHQHLVTAADTTSAVAVAAEDEDDDDAPLDLSESDMGSVDGRKSHDIRRVFRLPPQIVHVRSEMPEQTEPEDLSVHRMAAAADSVAAAMAAAHSPDSMLMMHDDLDLDELDDAAALYMRQQQLQLAAVASLKGGIKME